jgi:uncharacterized protein (DUF1501 family)
MAVTRRLFLKSSGVALASFAAAPSFLKRTVLAQTAAAGSDRPIIIAIFQRGAMDGISAVVPFGDKNYYSVRPNIAVAEPKAGNADAALDLDGYFALHPALAAFKPIYDEGHLAIVHAVGSPDNTRSHFDAQDYMEAGTPGNKEQPTVAECHMQARDLKATLFRAVSFIAICRGRCWGSSIGGQHRGLRCTRAEAGSCKRKELYSTSLGDALHGTGREAFEAVKMLKKANPQQYSASNGANYPRSPFGNSLLQISQLIKANVGIEVAFTDVGGWDTHANQGSARGQLANRLQDFSQGVAALYKDLGERMRNVVILTMTEFGRTIRQNGSGGTDHGHASCLFVAGGPVKGGKVYGKWPGLATDQLYEGRDLALTTDFRDVFSEIAARHLGAGNLNAIFPGFNASPANFRGFIRA